MKDPERCPKHKKTGNEKTLLKRKEHIIKCCLHFRRCQCGSSLSGLCTLNPPLGPPSTPAKKCRHTCLGGEFFLAISGNSKHFLFYKKTHQILFCFALKPPAKFHNPRTTPSGRKVTQEEERKK